LNDIFDISTGETDMLVLANLDLPPQRIKGVSGDFFQE